MGDVVVRQGAQDTRNSAVAPPMAPRIATAADGSDEKKRCETERHQRAARAAMETAIRISDDLVRDLSVRQIVSLCVAANDLRTARVFLRATQAVSIREDVLNDRPILRR